MSKMRQRQLLTAHLPLLIIIFIDNMGLSLFFPILNDIIVDPTVNFLRAGVSVATREFLYGLLVSIFMLCWLFGSVTLGDLSDRVGRKKTLLICLLGSAIGYIMSAVSVWVHSLLLLATGRIIAGFTAGSQPVAQAAIIDVSASQHKVRNIGLVLLSASLGFVLGPIFGALLSESQLVAWFDFSTPLYFAALLSLANAVLLYRLFQETYDVKGALRIRLSRATDVLYSAWKDPRIRHLSLILLVMFFGWSAYFTFIPMFMLTRYHFSLFENSLFFAVMGCGYSIGCGLLLDYCVKRYPRRPLVVAGFFLTALGVLLTVTIHQAWVAWSMVFFLSITIAVADAVLLSIFSDRVTEAEQGWVMGVTGSIMALSFGVNALLTGVLVIYGVTLPLALSVVWLVLSGVLMMLYGEAPSATT